VEGMAAAGNHVGVAPRPGQLVRPTGISAMVSATAAAPEGKGP